GRAGADPGRHPGLPWDEALRHRGAQEGARGRQARRVGGGRAQARMRRLILEEWGTLDGYAGDKEGKLDFFPPSEEDQDSDRDLSIAKTSSAGQVVDPSALVRRESQSVTRLLLDLLHLLPFLLGGHRQLALQNLALRQQLAVYKRVAPRPRLRTMDRLFWVVLARAWTGWRQALVIVSPDTVLRWQRQRFRAYWAQLSSRPTRGRPCITAASLPPPSRVVQRPRSYLPPERA